MAAAPLLVFDFDGVLVDGMAEYWWAARHAALQLDSSLTLPELAPPGFSLLRPRIHQGWEMVLMAAELGRPGFDPGAAASAYDRAMPAALAAEGADWAVLTTKGGAFAARLLAAAGLTPVALYGHEQGSKPEVLLQLRTQGRPLWFVEDRRPTLELVRATPGLEEVRCYLASWGYLAPGDGDGLAVEHIRWLTPAAFAAPLADWP